MLEVEKYLAAVAAHESAHKAELVAFERRLECANVLRKCLQKMNPPGDILLDGKRYRQAQSTEDGILVIDA